MSSLCEDCNASECNCQNDDYKFVNFSPCINSYFQKAINKSSLNYKNKSLSLNRSNNSSAYLYGQSVPSLNQTNLKDVHPKLCPHGNDKFNDSISSCNSPKTRNVEQVQQTSECDLTKSDLSLQCLSNENTSVKSNMCDITTSNDENTPVNLNDTSEIFTTNYPNNNVPILIDNSHDKCTTFGLVKRGLRIANINICHLLPKLDEVKILLHERRTVDILGVCETFLDNKVDDALLQIDDYVFERKDRYGKSGGGILVYISNSNMT